MGSFSLTGPSVSGVWSLSLWIAREVPLQSYCKPSQEILFAWVIAIDTEIKNEIKTEKCLKCFIKKKINHCSRKTQHILCSILRLLGYKDS